MKKTYICHVCGYSKLEESPWINKKIPSHNICDCCGVEFGYEDCSENSIIAYRDKWMVNGASWFNPKLKPKNWSLEQQLENLKKLKLR